MAGKASKGALIRQQALRSTILNSIGQAVTLGTGLLLTPFLVHQLGPGALGLWILVGSVTAYGSLLDLGIAGAVTKYIAEFRATGRTEQAQALIATAFSLYVGLGALALLLSAAVAPFIPDLFHIPPEDRTQATWLVLLLGVSVGASIVAGTNTAILRGLQRFDLLTLMGVSGSLLSSALTVLVVLAGGDVIGMALAGVCVQAVMLYVGASLVRRTAPELRPGLRRVSLRLVRTVVSYSLWLSAADVAWYLQSKTDAIVIGAFLPVHLITPYAIAARLSDVAQILPRQFLKILLPLASQLHAENDHERLRSLFLVSTRLTLAIALPVVLVLILLSPSILTAWIGPEYGSYAYLTLILGLAGLVDLSAWPAGSLLQAMARHRLLALSTIASGIMNLLLSVALVGQLGLIGVALGTLVPTVLECLCFAFPYALRVVGVSTREVLVESLIPASLPALPMVAALVALTHFLQPTSLPMIGIVACSSLVIYALGYLCMAATKLERQALQPLVVRVSKSVTTFSSL